VLESLPGDGKTKTFVSLVAKLPSKGRKTLLLNGKKNDKIMRATRNVKKIDLDLEKNVSLVDLLNHQYIVITKEAVKLLEKRLVQ
jgi:large subunit ribosomal protein L4